MKTIETNNLDTTIDLYVEQRGYRLDMIVPADNPREAVLSKGDERVRLVSEPPTVAGGSMQNIGELNGPNPQPFEVPIEQTADRHLPAAEVGSDWVTGRAGMEYRDLIPDRSGGKVIASHIRLTKGGKVPDYVHYHKVDFQVIYCKRGRIRVVYEDQGEPFWLETGDCVLQPPEIRHRVLECTAGAEVIEVSMPAEHETWVEHEIELPTAEYKPDRDFGGQRFVRHIAASAEWTTDEIVETRQRDTGITLATHDKAYVCVTKTRTWGELPIAAENDKILSFCLRLDEDEYLTVVIIK